MVVGQAETHGGSSSMAIVLPGSGATKPSIKYKRSFIVGIHSAVGSAGGSCRRLI